MTENIQPFAGPPTLEAVGQAPQIPLMPPFPGGPPNVGSSFADLEQSAVHLPRLNMAPVMTVARDRWERLVTTLDIAEPPEQVWQALTDPDRLKKWLAVCHGSFVTIGRDCTLDFEDGEFFLCRPVRVDPPNELRYLWRWLGIGQATSVTWRLDELPSPGETGSCTPTMAIRQRA